jgi:hypothetical protein
MKVIVPTSLAEIRLSQYLRYLKAVEEAKKLNEDKWLDVIMVEIFCGLTRIEALNIEYSFISEIAQRIGEILKQEPDLVERFQVGDLTFGWIPKLDDMTYAEFLDLNSNIGDWENIVTAMGVLYRPIKKEFKGKYLIEKYKGDTYHDALKEMPMDAVVGSMVFFWNLGIDCTTYMAKYLETESLLTIQNQTNLVNSGVGIQQSMNSLVTTLQSLKRY